MKLRHLLVAGLAVVAVACNSTASPTPSPDPNAAFCGSLKDVAVAVADYHRLGPDDTIEAYKAAAQTVADSVQTAVDAAKNLKEAKADDLSSAVTALESYLQNPPQDVPVAEVKAQIGALTAEIAAARLSLGVTVCKQPAPPSFAPAASAPAASPAPAAS